MSEEPTISIASALSRWRKAASTRSRGTFSPKNTTSGLSTPPQRRHGGMTKDEKSAPSRSASPSGRFRCVKIEPVGIEPAKFVLQFDARRSPLAIHAADEIDPPVQVDHPRAASRLVQPIHVLGQKKLASARRLELGQSAMRVVGRSLTNEPPADEAARPIAAARLFLAHEGLIGHRLGAFPLALGVAIVRNARRRAAARAGQDEQALVPIDEVLQAGIVAHPLISLNPSACVGLKASGSYRGPEPTPRERGPRAEIAANKRS